MRVQSFRFRVESRGLRGEALGFTCKDSEFWVCGVEGFGGVGLGFRD